MPRKVNHIKLSNDAYLHLRRSVQGGHHAARALNQARILLLADTGMADEDIADPMSVGRATGYRVRKTYREAGLDAALAEKPRRGAPAKVDGRVEATLTMLACSAPPEGYRRWTLRLLAEKLVELQGVESISLPTVHTVQKKMD